MVFEIGVVEALFNGLFEEIYFKFFIAFRFIFVQFHLSVIDVLGAFRKPFELELVLIYWSGLNYLLGSGCFKLKYNIES